MIKLIWVEIEELSKMGWIEITEIGEENMYFTKNGKNYFCKIA